MLSRIEGSMAKVAPLTACQCSCGLHDAAGRQQHAPGDVHGCSVFSTGGAGVGFAADVQHEHETHACGGETCVHPVREPYEDADGVEVRYEAEAAVATLQLQVNALRKYKANYELLCGQLDALNAQIGLQLERHEADVATLQASAAALQHEKAGLEIQLAEAQQALATQREAAAQDREYSEGVHRQLSTAAKLLKATETRLGEQTAQHKAETQSLQAQLTASKAGRAGQQAAVVTLQKELEVLRTREAEAREQRTLQRQRDKRKHKKELMARASKLRAVTGELETQRAEVRATRKAMAQLQTDNDALRKQVGIVKRDGAHLAAIIDSQRADGEAHGEQLLQAKKTKKHLSNRVASLTQEADALRSELADVTEELVDRNNELQACRTELKGARGELRQYGHALEEAKCLNEKLTQQLDALKRAEVERCQKAEAAEHQQRTHRERQYRKELAHMRGLLAATQQHASESSRDVQKLKRELLGVQKLLRGCKDDTNRHDRSKDSKDVSLSPMDQWAEVMRNSVKAEEAVLKSAIMDQVRAFAA